MRSVLASLALGYVAVASAFMSGVLSTALFDACDDASCISSPLCFQRSTLLPNSTAYTPCGRVSPWSAASGWAKFESLPAAAHGFSMLQVIKMYCANFLSYACKCLPVWARLIGWKTPRSSAQRGSAVIGRGISGKNMYLRQPQKICPSSLGRSIFGQGDMSTTGYEHHRICSACTRLETLWTPHDRCQNAWLSEKIQPACLKSVVTLHQ